MHLQLVLSFSLVALCISISISSEDDLRCLSGIKSSVSDPRGMLTWKLSNASTSVCGLVGVSCWNEKENRLISLQLRSMYLAGPFPDSLSFCQSLQTLDLSGNDLSGSIPSKICSWLPYLVYLDLSNNHFLGPIPPEMVQCKFLNTLNLNNNKLSGSIPYELGQLGRLKKFSVVNNDFSGLIPSDLSRFGVDSFRGNENLCGKPLRTKCRKMRTKDLVTIIAAGVFGAFLSFFLGFFVWLFFTHRNGKKGCYDEGEGGDDWVETLRAHELIRVTLFEKPIVKIKLNDLIACTNGFASESIIVGTKMGVSYKAVLPDGSALVIKRLSACELSEKQFRSELNRLGQLRHPNLVPLLGFCAVENEKFLVYKHMVNGTLYSFLHRDDKLDWRGRVRICIGSARGLAWLHHGCDPPTLHQNLSSKAILIDDDLVARISEFGLTRLTGSVDSTGSLFVNGDLGENGYIAPEYSTTMVASMNGDVYSFGVVLLEIVTGQKALEVSDADDGFKSTLVDWVTRLCGSGKSKDVIDKSLRGRGDDDEIMQLLKIACTCVASRPKDRPSMHNVYQSLKGLREDCGFYKQSDDFPLDFGKQDVEM